GVVLSDAGWEIVADAEWLHVDHVGWPLVDRWWRSRSHRPHLSVDAGNPVDGLSLAGVDLYVPTLGALRSRYGELATDALLVAALADGARVVVATDGSRGAWIAEAGEPPRHVPA